MTAATWVPGDPLMPDNGCGAMTDVHLSADERAAVRDEGGEIPPWFRPGEDGPKRTQTRSCTPCGVQWFGQAHCWMCGQEPT